MCLVTMIFFRCHITNYSELKTVLTRDGPKGSTHTQAFNFNHRTSNKMLCSFKNLSCGVFVCIWSMNDSPWLHCKTEGSVLPRIQNCGEKEFCIRLTSDF